jgi:MFS family permease
MDYAKIARSTTIVLFITQTLVSFANSVTATVNTIIGAKLSGDPRLAGVPGAAIQVGSALTALILGYTLDRFGRRLSIAAGIGLGVLGAVVAALSIASGSFLFFLAGLAIFGFTRAAALMGRFVAAEVSPPHTRGRAISYVILGGTIGSVIGPWLADPSSRLAEVFGLNELAGPYIIALAAFVLSSALILLTLRPEPRDVGREIAARYPETLVHNGASRSRREILRNPTALTAIVSMVFGQVVMIALMGITSLHMIDHQHTLEAVGSVFSAHTFGMFAPSLITGQLLDRWGRGPVILAGAILLGVSCAIAPIWLEVAPIAFALFLLGLGWNFCYVGGSTLLADVLTPDERARTQAANDVLIALTTALASYLSGEIFAAGGYTLAGIVGAVASLVPLAFVAWWMVQPRAVVTA